MTNKRRPESVTVAREGVESARAELCSAIERNASVAELDKLTRKVQRMLNRYDRAYESNFDARGIQKVLGHYPL